MEPAARAYGIYTTQRKKSVALSAYLKPYDGKVNIIVPGGGKKLKMSI